MRFALPVFFNVSVCDDLLPTRTFPKLMLVGLVVRSPAAIPVPERGTFAVPLELTKATLPAAVPGLVGAKRALKLAFCPGAKVKDWPMPVMLYPVPVTVTAETVMLDPPVFETDPATVWVVPICTFPKLMLIGAGVSCPGVWACCFAPRPPHPRRPARLAMIRIACQRIFMRFIIISVL